MGFITGLAFPRIELALAGMVTFKELLPEGLSFHHGETMKTGTCSRNDVGGLR